MATNSKQTIQAIVLLYLGVLVMNSFAMFGLWLVGSACSQLITKPAIYPSSWRRIPGLHCINSQC